jgi:hypothetical protein
MALATHACGGETQAVRISRPVGLVCFECHVAIVFFAIYLEPWFFFFTLTRFHPNNFSEYFRTNNKERLQGGFFGFVAVCRFRSILVLFVAGFAMALATHACGAEAEAVRISRLVGLVCCECHIAMFFLQFTWNHGFSFSR